MKKMKKKIGMPLAPCVLKVWVNLNCTDDPISALYCSLHSIYCCIVSIQSGEGQTDVLIVRLDVVLSSTKQTDSFTVAVNLHNWMEWRYFNDQFTPFLFTPQSALDLISFQIFCSSDQVKKGKVEKRIKCHWSFPLVFHKS